MERRWLPLPFLIFLALAVIVQAPDSQYDFRGFYSSFALSEEGLSFNYPGTCDAQMSSRSTFSSSSTFDSTITWKSPSIFALGFNTRDDIDNTSCLSYGETALKSVLRDGTSNLYESLWDVSHSADSGFVNTMTRYVCDVTGDSISFTITNTSDSQGICPYGVRTTGSDQRIAFLNELSTNYNECGDLTSWIPAATCTRSQGGCTDCEKTHQYIYPFNSSSIGNVTYNITKNLVTVSGGGQQVTVMFTVDLLNADTQTITPLHTDTQLVTTSDEFLDDGTLSLTADTQYVLILTFNTTKSGGVVYTFVSHGPDIDFGIFTFRPDYECGDFTDCINGTESQVCQDSFGVAPDEIRTRTCFDVPAHEIDLGFEAILDFTPQFIYTCQANWVLGTCPSVLSTIPAQFPVNWSISADLDRPGGAYRQNYIRISSNAATVGTKSLQMNYIPPKPEEPISDPGNSSLTICGNKTQGDFPFVVTGLNQSLFVSINVTFPSPFIQLRWDALKCSEQILQYDYTGDFFDINCGKRCYATNCTTDPRGKYTVGVFDANTAETVEDVDVELTTNAWELDNILDLSNAGLLVGRNYTIIIVVNVEETTGVFDPNAHCAYFDNFRITVTEEALPECVTSCRGLDLLQARQIGNDCFFKTITNSPMCAPDEDTAEAFENLEQKCIGTTLHFFNNDTKLWDTIADNEICVEEQNVTEADTSITEPISGTVEALDLFEFMWSPIFLYFIISLIISGILAGGVSKATGSGHGVFEVFGVTMLIMILIGTLPGISIIPIWVAIIIAAAVSLLIASKLAGLSIVGGG